MQAIVITTNKVPTNVILVDPTTDPIAKLEDHYALTTGKELSDNKKFDSFDFSPESTFEWKNRDGDKVAATLLEV